MMTPKENPGLNKLVEEMGEALQLAGKLLAYPDGEHPDGGGNLYERLAGELGDVLAALRFFGDVNLPEGLRAVMYERAQRKRELFVQWHEREDG